MTFLVYAKVGVLLLKKMVNKKVQAVMELLAVYGWAILVVLIAIGALAYLGVFNPKENCKILPDSKDECCKKNYGEDYTYYGEYNDCGYRFDYVAECRGDEGERITTTCYVIRNSTGYAVFDKTSKVCCGEIGLEIYEGIEETSKDAEGEPTLLDLSCNELEKEFNKFLSRIDKNILITNIMILKDCELKTTEKYVGKCSNEKEKIDYWFEKGDLNRVERLIEEYNKCMEN